MASAHRGRGSVSGKASKETVRAQPRPTSTSTKVTASSSQAAGATDAFVGGARIHEPTRLVGAQARIEGRWPVLTLTGVSLLACCLMFPPVGWWWLGYVALVPWLVCVCTGRTSRFVYFVSLLFGLGFFLICVYWMASVTLPGYLALCVGYSIFFPLAAWPIRHMYQRHGLSVALTAPIVWVATEYLRSISTLGFPFLLLGHSQYKIVTIIQISDLVGAYGVSFVLAMVNGWITDLLIQPILIWRAERGTRLPVGSLTTLVVLLGTLIYGSAQRSHKYFKPGPKVAVVQHDFPMFVDERAGRTPTDTIFNAYLELARKAAAEKPDLIVLPETAMSCYVNDEFLDATPADLDEIHRRRLPYRTKGQVETYQRFSRQIRDAFQELSTQSGVPIVLGSSSLEWRPKAIPPGVEAFNSAFLLQPDRTRPVARYDKIHLVLFGEYVPFRFSYRPLYEWLNSLTPWGREGIEYSLSAGSDYTAFEFQATSQDGRKYRAAVPICYEEIMPYIARRFVRGDGPPHDHKNIDMLLSISNDGWFLHSAELEQHLMAGVFRAVENRIPVARAVNTGASGQIHPNGKIHALVTLSEAQAKLLDPVAASLHKLADSGHSLEANAANDEVYRRTFQEAGRLCGQDLRRACSALGAEFGFIDERLAFLLADAAAKSLEQRRRGVQAFREQIDDDLEMIDRWKDRPWTAPGYLVANMKCDDRVTIYARWGDWFAQATVALLVLILADWLVRRILRRRLAEASSRIEESAP